MKVIAFILLLLPFLSTAISGNLRGGRKNEVSGFTADVRTDLSSAALEANNEFEETKGYHVALNELMENEDERKLSSRSYR